MKGERQQKDDPNKEERPFKYNAGDRTIGVEMSQSASVASAAAEFLAEGDRRKSNVSTSRTYNRRPGERQAFLVLREGRGTGLSAVSRPASTLRGPA